MIFNFFTRFSLRKALLYPVVGVLRLMRSVIGSRYANTSGCWIGESVTPIMRCDIPYLPGTAAGG